MNIAHCYSVEESPHMQQFTHSVAQHPTQQEYLAPCTISLCLGGGHRHHILHKWSQINSSRDADFCSQYTMQCHALHSCAVLVRLLCYNVCNNV